MKVDFENGFDEGYCTLLPTVALTWESYEVTLVLAIFFWSLSLTWDRKETNAGS